MSSVFAFILRAGWPRFLRLSALVAAATLASLTANAQFDSGAVNGQVSDPSGAAVVGADVKLHNVELSTDLTRKTNSEGRYEFPDVQAGTYTVTVDAPGFAESVTKQFDVAVSAKLEIDVPLAVGGADSSITVTVDTAGLQTESNEQSTTVETKQIVDLPLNGREYTDLALLVPGVQVGSLQDTSVQQRRGSIVVNGNRSSVNNFLLDGLDNNSYQEANQGFNNQAVAEQADAVQEYTIITSDFPAEYGRAGGAVVNVKTKSGSDQPRGSFFNYLRNTSLNTYGPFYGTGEKPALVQNQFGGTFGWRVPKVQDMFFFVDYQGFRQATHTIMSATLPTIDQRNGILYNESAAPVPVQNPMTGKQYTTGIIPRTDFTPFAAAVLDALPKPTVTENPGQGVNFVTLGPGHNFSDIGDIRLDKYFGNKLQTFARVSKQAQHILAPESITGPAGGNGFGHARVLTSSGVAGATYVLTPNSVLDLRFGLTTTNSGKVPYNQGIANFYSKFGIPYPVSTQLEPSGLNTQDLLDFSGFGVEATENQFSSPTIYDLKGNYTLAKGKHSYSFGYEWEHVSEVVDPSSPLLGLDTYSGEFSYLNCCGKPASSIGRRQSYAMADFIFGARDTYQISNYAVDTEYFDYHYAYAEDAWRVFPRLTVNYGLRYEFSTPERVHGQPLVNFDPTTNALQIGSSGSIYNQALVNPKLDDFAPRLGFAFSLRPKIVLRGGYGLSFIQFNRYGSESDLLSNPPTTIETTVTQSAPYAAAAPEAACPDGSQSLACFRTTMQGYPSSAMSPQNFATATSEVYYIPRNSLPGYVQSYSLDTQVQLDKGTIVSASYVGTHGVHVRVLADYNEASQQLPNGTVPLNYSAASPVTRRPIQNFTDIHESISAGYLRYNSLQAKLTHRASGGLFLMNSFTWSHGFDNASASLEQAHGDGEFISLRNPHNDDGTSGYDQRWNDSLGATWKIPHGRYRHNPLLRQAAAGWTLTSIARTTAGIPINIYYTPNDNDLTSDLITYRPNLNGSVKHIMNPRSQWVYSPAKGYSNVLAGSTPNAAGTSITAPAAAANGGTTPYGNIARNVIRGPHYINLDLGVQKNFSLREGLRLQFRCEAFNIANHTNFKTPNSNFSSSTYGAFAPGYSSVFPSRQIQLAARLNF